MAPSCLYILPLSLTDRLRNGLSSALESFHLKSYKWYPLEFSHLRMIVLTVKCWRSLSTGEDSNILYILLGIKCSALLDFSSALESVTATWFFFLLQFDLSFSAETMWLWRINRKKYFKYCDPQQCGKILFSSLGFFLSISYLCTFPWSCRPPCESWSFDIANMYIESKI